MDLQLKQQTPTFTAIAILVFICAFANWYILRDSALHIASFSLLAGLSFYLLRNQGYQKQLMVFAVVLRILMLFALPRLSDDYFRFLWDGHLWLAGYHPLDFLPNEAPPIFANQHLDLLNQMNSAGYFTVYPPISQLGFTLGAYFQDSIFTGVFALKLFILFGEILLLYFLYQVDQSKSKSAVILYGLFPLSIVELCGNLHFEGLAILGVILAIYGYQKNKPILSGFGLAFGIAAKLVPALIGPALLIAWLRKGDTIQWKSSFLFSASALLFCIFFFLPFFYSADLTGFGQSLDLYFRKFEFNGSLYAIASAVGKWYKGWNWISVIGPSLSLVSALSILCLSFYRSWMKKDLATTLLYCFGIYILCATTVHPWYVIYLLPLAPLADMRWPFVLGTTIWLSYLAYGQDPVRVPNVVLLFEYGIPLAYLVYEIVLQAITKETKQSY